jgi:hypothetical protein
MSRVIYKSIRCLAFGLLLFFAGATDMFSVDLDSDGDVDTDVIVPFDHVASLRASVPSPEEEAFSTQMSFVFLAGLSPEPSHLAVPLDISRPALGSPQLLVPLRT